MLLERSHSTNERKSSAVMRHTAPSIDVIRQRRSFAWLAATSLETDISLVVSSCMKIFTSHPPLGNEPCVRSKRARTFSEKLHHCTHFCTLFSVGRPVENVQYPMLLMSFRLTHGYIFFYNIEFFVPQNLTVITTTPLLVITVIISSCILLQLPSPSQCSPRSVTWIRIGVIRRRR